VCFYLQQHARRTWHIGGGLIRITQREPCQNLSKVSSTVAFFILFSFSPSFCFHLFISRREPCPKLSKVSSTVVVFSISYSLFQLCNLLVEAFTHHPLREPCKKALKSQLDSDCLNPFVFNFSFCECICGGVIRTLGYIQGFFECI